MNGALSRTHVSRRCRPGTTPANVLSILLLFPLSLWAATRTIADEPADEIYAGDSVLTVRAGVELGLRNEAGVVLPAGHRIQVTEVRGEWIGGYALVGEKKHTGWVQRNQVRLAELSTEVAATIVVPDKPDAPEAIRALEQLGVALERNAAGYVVAADGAGKDLTDAAMIHFSTLHHLATLQLAGCSIGDDGVKQLSGLSGLQELYLDQTQVTDAGLAHLGRLSNLEVLTLSGSKVAGGQLKLLQPLPHLRVLNLSQCSVTDQSLAAVGALARLEVLALADSQVGSDGLSHLKGLTRLRVLNLNGTDVQVDGLEHLTTLEQLRMLYVRNTTITDDDTWTLTEANPSLAVYTE